jgi:alpha-1,3-mannosyl-glycoprotein beta-1,2-N-acetylglucosaminyltransferase
MIKEKKEKRMTHVRKKFLIYSGAIYRSDFFPGLGWLMPKKLWKEVSPMWPSEYWDDWLRNPLRRQERACLIPEVTRTLNFGKYGVSNGEFFDEHIATMAFYSDANPVDFLSMDMSYLLKSKYDRMFLEKVYHSTLISDIQTLLSKSPGDPLNSPHYRVEYSNNKEFESLAKQVGLMSDIRVRFKEIF